jgi:hypothetical protein
MWRHGRRTHSLQTLSKSKSQVSNCNVLFWHINHGKPVAPTQATIHCNLLEAETRDLAAGNDFMLDADISPALLISLGLDLEAEQYVDFFTCRKGNDIYLQVCPKG